MNLFRISVQGLDNGYIVSRAGSQHSNPIIGEVSNPPVALYAKDMAGVIVYIKELWPKDETQFSIVPE